MENESFNKTKAKHIRRRNKNMKITIESNKTLLDILDDKRKVLKLVTIIVVLVMTIFIGLAFITVSVKSVYPYNLIRVNTFGATTMKDESKEINYWLFNTAELWANSGIYVEKGDILTIRSSGKFNTAIHHMIDAAENNYQYTSGWSGPEGHPKDNDRDLYRAEYRICKSKVADALIMQVVPEGKNLIDDSLLTFSEKNKENIYFIGKECVDLHINNNGHLHFAVNDIVLTRDVINEMIKHNNSLIDNEINKNKKNNASDDISWNKYNSKFFHFGKTPNGTCKRDMNEMTYYRDSALYIHDSLYHYGENKNLYKSTKLYANTYYNVWFDDNVGSFLIVVERKKQ